jgi:SAM-dependent methyltransferase
VTTRLYTEEAELYDIAFSWDLDEEAAWLLGRLGGSGVRTLLEPACGSGRVLEAFAAVGVEAVGIDLSPRMVALANERLARKGLPGEARLADMVSFDLGRTFDGAVCPIDSVACLHRPADVVRHLHSVAHHLGKGGKYLVQIELRDPDEPWASVAPSSWIAEREGVRLRIDWTVREIDLDRGLEVQHSRIEVLSGPRQGEVLEETHLLAAWTPARWAGAILRSPFSYARTFDGDQAARPELPLGAPGRLLWHELVVDDR